MLTGAHFTYFIIDPIQNVFFFAPRDRGGLALEAPLKLHKINFFPTSRHNLIDTMTLFDVIKTSYR